MKKRSFAFIVAVEGVSLAAAAATAAASAGAANAADSTHSTATALCENADDLANSASHKHRRASATAREAALRAPGVALCRAAALSRARAASAAEGGQ